MYIGRHLSGREVIFLEHSQIQKVLEDYRNGESNSTAEQCVDYICGILDNTNKILEILQTKEEAFA